MLLDPRITYSPFEYQFAFEVLEKQIQSHWSYHEFNMASDINDWKTILTPHERNVVSFILKGFTTAEVFIGNYWSTIIPKFIKKPEVQMAAVTFASFEAIHAVSYAYLDQSLGLEDYEAYLQEPSIRSKIDRLMQIKNNSKEDLIRSIAIFSAFNEGVSLFSSFAVLMNFSRFNKLKNLGSIIAYSVRDENLHQQFGCYLVRVLAKEYPEVWTDELKKDIYDAARLTVELEDNFIDKAFEMGDLEGLTKKDLKNFIRNRTNTALEDLGLKKNWKNIDKESLERMDWFDAMSSGVNHGDFFSVKSTDYAKFHHDWSKIWD